MGWTGKRVLVERFHVFHESSRIWISYQQNQLSTQNEPERFCVVSVGYEHNLANNWKLWAKNERCCLPFVKPKSFSEQKCMGIV